MNNTRGRVMRNRHPIFNPAKINPPPSGISLTPIVFDHVVMFDFTLDTGNEVPPHIGITTYLALPRTTTRLGLDLDFNGSHLLLSFV
jgi:hypothetical protein